MDSKRHAIFDDPVYAARAFAKVMWSYRFRHDIITSRGIFNRYAPSSDCVGSLERDPETGRCPQGESPSLLYARIVADRLGRDLDEDLGLFNSAGVMQHEVLVELAMAVASFELGRGWRVNRELILDGLRISGIEHDLP